MIRQEIINNLKIALEKIGIRDDAPHVEFPANFQMGDFASNVALKYAGKLHQQPMQIAESIVKNFPQTEGIEKIDVVKPGFINFWISQPHVMRELQTVLAQKDAYGKSEKYKGKKILLEYTDPNPLKEFHIGHLFSNIVGESLARLHEYAGAEVKRANYQGDVGMHVAKSLWGMKQKMNTKHVSLEELEKKPLQDRIKFLGESYVEGAQQFEENQTAKDEITEINKKIYLRDPEIFDTYQKGRSWSLDYFETIYKRLDTNYGNGFDYYFFESEVGEIGASIVQEYLEKGIFQKSEGAVIFPGEQYGLHNRVFINSLGLPTYEAKELGLAVKKYETYPFDTAIVVTGNEINEYFKVLLAVLSKIRPDIAQKTKHISHGMVRLPEGKMSSRKGNVITGEWLLDTARDEVMNIMKHPDTTTADSIGNSAVKYALLKNSTGKDVEFNFAESVSLEGNSGPYLQYAYVRCASVLEKSTFQELKFHDISLTDEEKALVRTIFRFPYVVEEAVFHLAPHLIATHLYDLAQKFNVFYQKHPILKEKDEIKHFRLSLTKAVAQVLKNGLHLLGIRTVEKM